jgi:hypothetical protein
MRSLLRREQTAGDRAGSEKSVPSRAGHRLRSVLESGVLGVLLLTAAVSAMVGSPAMLVCAVVGAWLSLAAMMGPRNVLDAGCYFMLLVVGVIVVVELAIDGLGALLP